MSRTITISDALYQRLAEEARQRGLNSVEQLLERLSISEEREQRREVVARIDALRNLLAAKYGEMPDSTELLREDRARE